MAVLPPPTLLVSINIALKSVSECNVSFIKTTHLLIVNSVLGHCNMSVHSDLVSVHNTAINELVLPIFSDSKKQMLFNF
jgi:hypothetical protein